MGRYDVLLQQDRKQEAATMAERAVPAPSVRKKADTTTAGPVSVSQPKPTASVSAKRSFVRRSFDFYEDQVSYLTRTSLEERLAGKEGSMNAMVREAVDDYTKKRTGEK